MTAKMKCEENRVTVPRAAQNPVSIHLNWALVTLKLELHLKHPMWSQFLGKLIKDSRVAI